MRDPRDIVKGRIDAAVNRQVYDATVAARTKADAPIRKVAKGGDALEAKVTGKMSWWPFGRKQDDSPANGCPGCAKEVDPSWGVCPYCGTDLKKQPPAGQAPMPMPVPGGQASPPPPAPGAPNKTVAIDIEALKAPRKGVIGWIVVMVGSQKGMDFRLYPGKNSIGAAADNDIVITDEYLSSKHAAIRFEDGKYEFIDHDSTNGSFVNEKRVSKEELIDNDTIRLGRTEFRFKALY